MPDRVCLMTTSASRPRFLEAMLESLWHNVLFDGDISWIVHEDILNHGRSEECVKLIKEFPWSWQHKIDHPPIGQGHSLTWLLNQVDTRYVLNWEDDFAAIREIDLELAVHLLDKFPGINQIAFHKRQTMSEKPGFVKKEVKFGDVTLTTDPHWALTPALWRVSYIKPRWVDFKQGGHWDLNRSLKEGANSVLPAEWVIANTGTYFMGPIGENQFVQHLGAGYSLRVGEEQRNW